MPVGRRRAVFADVLGLGAILFVLLDYLRPSLLLIPTIAAGGDTPCHYPTAVYLHDQLLPRLRLHGWYPGAYLGHPLLLYYFPLPFLLMAALAPLTGMPVAFKLGTALGVFLLPFFAYAAFRFLGFKFPTPLLGAAATLVFLFVEDNPIWGGTLASTLTGEFAYTYGIGLGLLFLGVVYRTYARGGSASVPAGILALTALAHGYAVLWAGFSATYFLFSSRRPARTLSFLLGVAALAFALVGFWLLPLLSGWGFTTPYDDAWISVGAQNLFPPLLRPLFALAIVGLGRTLVLARRTGGPDHRLLFLFHAAFVGAGLYLVAPRFGIIDVRFAPFAQLALALAGAASVGVLLEGFLAPDLAALGLVLLALFFADAHSRVLRSWIEWNYTGLERKELFPAFRDLSNRLRGGVGDPRVAVEYSEKHEKAGSIRMYETLPFFSGRSTLEGVYNQASLQTHEVYYLASELDERSPNPFRSRDYSSFDTESALAHLRLFNVSEIVALSQKLKTALAGRKDVEKEAELPPYTLFRLKDPGAGYVEPLLFMPVRSPREGFRDKAWRWFTRKPLSSVHLVFTDDPRFPAEKDEWLAPTSTPLAPGVVVAAHVENESLTIETNRVGHPLLVKISYHPRWRAEGADGPYLVSPGLMMVVPREPTVRLVYGRTLSDTLGILLSAGGLLAWAWGLRRRLPRIVLPPPSMSEVCELPPPPRRWGGLVPAGLLVLFAMGRCPAFSSPSEKAHELLEAGRRASAEGRYGDAAEYARGALQLHPPRDLALSLRLLRGESLLGAGEAKEAAEAFEAAVSLGSSPRLAEALLGATRAHLGAGEEAAAQVARERLLREFPKTPWAEGLRKEGP
jgi:hypothetical protein